MQNAGRRQRCKAITAKEYGPDPIDVHVGIRLRLRRTMLRLSQEQLAATVGVTFQQIQKYERGSNRVSASRLYDLSEALNTSISYFFEDLDDVTLSARPAAVLRLQATGQIGEAPRYQQDELARTKTLQLVRAFWTLQSDALRDCVLDLLLTLQRRS